MTSKQKPTVLGRKNCMEEIARTIYKQTVVGQDSCVEALRSSNRLFECDEQSMKFCSGGLFQLVRNTFANLQSAKDSICELMSQDDNFSYDTLQTISEINKFTTDSIDEAVNRSKRSLLRKNKRLMRQISKTIVIEDDLIGDEISLHESLDTDKANIINACQSSADSARGTDESLAQKMQDEVFDVSSDGTRTNESLAQTIQDEISEISPDKLYGDGLLILKKTMPVRIYNRRPRKKKRGRRKVSNSLQNCDVRTNMDINKGSKKVCRKTKKVPLEAEPTVEINNAEESRYGRTIRRPKRYDCFLTKKDINCIDAKTF